MDIYSSVELTDVIDTRFKPSTFLTNYFFPEVRTFDTAAIVFDRIKGARRLAPFVSPTVQGRPVRRNGMTTDTFTPAYIKPKMALVPGLSMVRRPGEPIGGNLSPTARRDLQIEDDLMLQVEMINNRLEWMAAQALTFGYVDVSGDDYPIVRVDFQRNALNQVVLAGVNLWSAVATATPMANLRSWSATVANNQGGSVTDVVLGSNGFGNMAATNEFKDLYKNFQPMGGALPSILPNVQDNDQKIYHGQFGQFRLWTYNATYTDEAGATQFYVQPNDVLLIARQGIQGVQAFGAIQDHDSMQPAVYFPKMWKENDPSTVMTMVQSAPLMVPRNVDGTFRATVL
jgi:hypothetical protein